MRVVPPITITDSMLLSSTIPEPDTSVGEVSWVSGTTYAIGDKRILTSTHKVYQRLTVGAGTTAPNLDPTNWLEVGSTNRWSMFDIYRNTASSFGSSGMMVTLQPNVRLDTIAIMGSHLENLVVQVTVDSVPVLLKSYTMTVRDPHDYYEYFFLDFQYKKNVIVFEVPPARNAIISISSTKGGSISSIVLGTQEYLGFTQRGHTNDALNFSNVTRDAYGNTKLVPRRSVPKTTQTLLVDKSNVSNILQIRDQLKASPAVWSGLDDSSEDYFDALLILGIYKNMSVSLDYPEHATCSIDLEEI